MLSKLASWFIKQDRSLTKALNPTKKLKIEGILFEIRKINPIDYLAGYKALSSSFDLYGSDAGKSVDALTSDKIKKHYIEIFTASVISPKLKRKNDESEGLYVDALFNNWDICERLYMSIMEFTYGKKKLKSLSYQRKS